ncbi:uncharacterized protein CANTADRAFT_24421 [Suhomyces tanzawaensis NRRL Y-17324]|uniref:Uncharacterized protein n=1 Tax=Suhomyces tanzawaensis NRRL Y-17324 TaxID=984487 RepID=A0A1E4SPT8_9ASCO|nr:uncharacterized protein CANTADRAFT_24421 [Suhomyces tanzawaensis NRRL Y-17324]ODV81505.1 hypothetical protein CANTADRAFT_24421 [Suhomyces tanzawaensis NRRL Y-17324]
MVLLMSYFREQQFNTGNSAVPRLAYSSIPSAILANEPSVRERTDQWKFMLNRYNQP